MIERPTVITDRLVIRALDHEDLIRLHRGDLDGFNRARGWPSSHLIEALPHFINDLMDDPTQIGWNVWTITLKGSGMIIGDVGLKGPPDNNGVVEIGYSMSIPYRGKGYMVEAVSGLIDHVLSDNRVRSIIAECEDSNLISKKVLSTVGMEMVERIGKDTYWKLDKKR